jgi:hypothetical protein
MAEMKTRPTQQSADAFLESIPDPQKRDDCRRIARWMTEATGADAVMWGSSIVGFGNTRYTYESGRQGDWFQIGFSPRKANIALYINGAVKNEKLAKLGKYKAGASCLYITRLTGVDSEVLKAIIRESLEGQGC